MNIKRDLTLMLGKSLGLTISSGLDLMKGKKDMILLKKKIPQLQNFDVLTNKKRQQLKPYYEEYISKISSEEWAISFELSVFLMVLCNIIKPKRIIDFGSGFSSFVFRFHMLNTSPKPIVWSVDDSTGWIEKTYKFLEAYDLPTENLITWEDFLKKDVRSFDLILHDLSSSPFVRWEAFKEVITRTAPNGIIIVDDIHNLFYRYLVKSFLNKANLTYYSLKHFTIDKFGRFSMLVYP